MHTTGFEVVGAFQSSFHLLTKPCEYRLEHLRADGSAGDSRNIISLACQSFVNSTNCLRLLLTSTIGVLIILQKFRNQASIR